MCINKDCPFYNPDCPAIDGCAGYIDRVTTKADRIRSMTIDEMARERLEYVYSPVADRIIGDFGGVYVKYIAGVEQPESYAEALQREIEWLESPWEGE